MKSLRTTLAISTVVLAAIAADAANSRPNIILIVSDDQGYADVGFHGSKEIPTPNLDALAASGTICTAGYVTFPVCSPSRAGFLAGRHGARFGYDTNPDQKTENVHAAGLPLSERTMAQKLLMEHEMGELFKVIGFFCGEPWEAIGFAQGDRTHTL